MTDLFDDSTTDPDDELLTELDALDDAETPDESRRDEPRVPLSAVHKERGRIRDIQSKLDALESNWQNVQSQLYQQQLMQQVQAAQAAQPEQEPEPDFDLDPGAFLKRENEKLAAQVQQLQQAEWQRQATAQQAAAYGQAVAKVAAMEDQFRAEHSDYDRAVAYLRERRNADLESWGMADPAEREQVIRNEIQFLTDRALRLGEDPAAAAYSMAKKWGFGQQGGSASARSGKGKSGDAMARLEAVRRGQRQAASLGSGGGLPPRASTEARDLLSLDGPSFDEHWRRVFGSSDIF